MKTFYTLVFLCLIYGSSGAQTVEVSGGCISDTVSLSQVAELINGKVAYTGTGTVDGNAGVAISIYWIGSPDNLWVLDFDGQPYFQSGCSFDIPPSSFNASCPWTAVTGTTCDGTDPLTIIGDGVLAVRMLGFTASPSGSMVLLNWQTASETDNRVFEVERSGDGNSWQLIGSVPGNGRQTTVSQYRFTDKQPLNGINYYRLLQKDNNGRSSYSVIVTASISGNKLFRVISHSKGNYELLVNGSQPAELAITDLSGRKLWSAKTAGGSYQLDLKGFPAGLYLLQVRIKDQVLTQKLINQ